MTELQKLELEHKERAGTITKREQKRLNASRNQGRTSEGYAEKRQRRKGQRNDHEGV
jgi:hypothetical protein